MFFNKKYFIISNQIIDRRLNEPLSDEVYSESDSDVSSTIPLHEKEKNLEQQNQTDISSDHEAVVKKISLSDLNDDAEELDFLFRRPSPAENISKEVNCGRENTSLEIKKKDPFFCDSGSGTDGEAREETDAEQTGLLKLVII